MTSPSFLTLELHTLLAVIRLLVSKNSSPLGDMHELLGSVSLWNFSLRGSEFHILLKNEVLPPSYPPEETDEDFSDTFQFSVNS